MLPPGTTKDNISIFLYGKHVFPEDGFYGRGSFRNILCPRLLQHRLSPVCITQREREGRGKPICVSKLSSFFGVGARRSGVSLCTTEHKKNRLGQIGCPSHARCAAHAHKRTSVRRTQRTVEKELEWSRMCYIIQPKCSRSRLEEK